LADDKSGDEEKQKGAGSDGAKPGTVGQATPSNSAAPSGLGSDYQFFVEGSSGGYNFGLGQSDHPATPQLDTSLPDWFKNASAGNLSASAPQPQTLKATAPSLPMPTSVPSLPSQPVPPASPGVPRANSLTATENVVVPELAQMLSLPLPQDLLQVSGIFEAAGLSATPDLFQMQEPSASQAPLGTQDTSVLPDSFQTPDLPVTPDLFQAADSPAPADLYQAPDPPVTPDLFPTPVLPDKTDLFANAPSSSESAVPAPAPTATSWTPPPPPPRAVEIWPSKPSPAQVSPQIPKPSPAPAPTPSSTPAADRQEGVPFMYSAPPQVAALRRPIAGAMPVPLDLIYDRRFDNLTLPADLNHTVERIFSLNDLDFNGFVDFNEITTMLEGDELTISEKQMVQLIYQVGKQIVSERPVTDHTVVPVMSKDDFKLAFASVVNSAFAGLATGSQQTPAPKAFIPTVYAEDDYPLGSIKSQAVKLGTMGDAYFAACLVSMIDMQPRSIMRMINTSQMQTFIILFPGQHGKGLEIMPPRAEEIMHYGLAEKYGYWYPLLEKAYGMYVAQHHKLASSLEHGKDPFARTAQAMEALTNGHTGSLVVADFDPEGLRARIMAILSKGKMMVAISADFIAQSATVAGAAPQPLSPYAVQGYDQNTARMIVRGVGTVNTKNLDESVLRLTTEQFAHYFKMIYFEKELENAGPATDIRLTKPASNPWRKVPGES